MRDAYVANNPRELAELQNRPSARTWSRITSLSLAVFDLTQTLLTTAYLDVYWPMEPGTILRSARLNPSVTVAQSGAAFLTYATVCVGVKKADKFDPVGKVYDSRASALSVGVPLPLVDVETPVAIGSGIVVRVVVATAIIPALVGSSIETFLGYEG